MSRTRGVALQLALARYLAAWWPHAESAGSGRNGTDVLGTPGVVWECKTSQEFRPLAWCKQARTHAGNDDITRPFQPAITVYLPNGIGAGSMGSAIAMMPLVDLVELLQQAGYVPGSIVQRHMPMHALEGKGAETCQ